MITIMRRFYYNNYKINKISYIYIYNVEISRMIFTKNMEKYGKIWNVYRRFDLYMQILYLTTFIYLYNYIFILFQELFFLTVTLFQGYTKYSNFSKYKRSELS